jgi:hypothetical protein
MQTIERIDASEPTILVRRSPASISDLALIEVRAIADGRGRESCALRKWLRDCVGAEAARRNSPNADSIEPPAWSLPWHTWNDSELAGALAASYSWYDVPTQFDTAVLLREVHRAIVTAAATRLYELHDAIQIAQNRKA